MKKLLNYLPSRLVSQDEKHPLHQLVIEKFPDNTWSVSYVCLGCKGKTVQYVHQELEEALKQMVGWYDDVTKHDLGLKKQS